MDKAKAANTRATYLVGEDNITKRLDIFIVEQSDFTRSSAKSLINSGYVDLMRNGQKVKAIPNTHIQPGDKVVVRPLPAKPNIKLDIIKETDDFLIINKVAGVLTHPRNEQLETEDTIADAVARHTGAETNRNGIVHRLDRFTSGVMVVAKNEQAFEHLKQQFALRQAEKCYIALVEGLLENKHYKINWPLVRDPKKPAAYRVGHNGKEAISEISAISSGKAASGVLIKPRTGRTHQIRIHLAHLGHPVVGDTLYGARPDKRYYLHSYKLSFNDSKGKRQSFEVPLPRDMVSQAKKQSISMKELYAAAR